MPSCFYSNRKLRGEPEPSAGRNTYALVTEGGMRGGQGGGHVGGATSFVCSSGRTKTESESGQALGPGLVFKP
jgi:hypothetical protein